MKLKTLDRRWIFLSVGIVVFVFLKVDLPTTYQPSAQTDGFYKFTQAAPGIGIMDYTLDAGPYRTSTGMFFQFMTDISWDTDDIACPPGQAGNGCEGDGDPGAPDTPAVGNDFDIYAGGYIPMTELGRVR